MDIISKPPSHEMLDYLETFLSPNLQITVVWSLKKDIFHSWTLMVHDDFCTISEAFSSVDELCEEYNIEISEAARLLWT